MLLELNIIPLARGQSISADIADMITIIAASGLDYRVTPTGTILEGEWARLMEVAGQCHRQMRTKTDRVITVMTIDDYDDRKGRLIGAVRSVEEKVGTPVRT